MTRQNTRIESEGAEFLVLGQLLIQGIPAYKAYTNMAGHDVIAIDPMRHSSARISVKSRWQTKPSGFLIKNFDCDFVVVVKLNRGSRDGRAEILPPEFLVFPVDVVRRIPSTPKWGKIPFRSIPDLQHYRDRWHVIGDFLRAAPRALRATG